VLLAPTGRILLLRHCPEEAGAAPPAGRGRSPSNRPPHRPFWATPGGGLDPGESWEDAALREETGLDLEVGPWLWEDCFMLQGFARVQLERFFLVRVPTEALPSGVEAFHAREGITEARWWSAEELDASPEPIFPERLGALLRRLLAEGPPRVPMGLA
jgi:ADP-ribose pyrophosphatase YjhB (NUDIX family)